MNEESKLLANAIKALAHRDGCSTVAKAIEQLAHEMRYLGSGDASTKMGAIEWLGSSMKEGLEHVGSAISELATEVSRHSSE